MKKVSLSIFFLSAYAIAVLGLQAPGDRVVLQNIYVVGNKKTKADIILRELSVNAGTEYSVAELERLAEEDRQKVYNTNLFNEVKIQTLHTSDTQVEWLIEVDERWYFYPAPIFEIADRNLMDWLINRDAKLNRFNYGLKVDQFNFRGRNERVRFIGQLGFERRFLLGYTIPYIEKSQRHGLAFDVAYNEREDMPYITEDHLPTYIEDDKINRRTLSTSVTHSYRPTFYNFHYTTLGFRTGTVSDTITYLNPNYYGDGQTTQRSFRLGYSYVHDRRDKRAFPLNGHYLEINAEKEGLGIYGDVNIFLLNILYSKYHDLGKGFYLANGLVGMATFPSNQPYFNYQALGYYGIFARGFELDVIEGPVYFLSKNSLRKRLFSTEKDISGFMPVKQFSKFKLEMYGKFFTDFAWVNNYPNYEISSRLTNTMMYSMGFGLDIVTMYDLVLRLEYSYNSEDEFNFAINIKSDI